jgi:hypothetical protein
LLSKLFLFPFLLLLLFYSFALLVAFFILFIHFSRFFQSLRLRTHWKWNGLTFNHLRFNCLLYLISLRTLFVFRFIYFLFTFTFFFFLLNFRCSISSRFWRFRWTIILLIYHFWYFLNLLLILFSYFLLLSLWLFLLFTPFSFCFILRLIILLTFLFRIITDKY